jgi:hypothetical protein
MRRRAELLDQLIGQAASQSLEPPVGYGHPQPLEDEQAPAATKASSRRAERLRAAAAPNSPNSAPEACLRAVCAQSRAWPRQSRRRAPTAEKMALSTAGPTMVVAGSPIGPLSLRLDAEMLATLLEGRLHRPALQEPSQNVGRRRIEVGAGGKPGVGG